MNKPKDNHNANSDLLAKFQEFLQYDRDKSLANGKPESIKKDVREFDLSQLEQIKTREIMLNHQIEALEIEFAWRELQELESELCQLEIQIEANKQQHKGFTSYLNQAGKKLNF